MAAVRHLNQNMDIASMSDAEFAATDPSIFIHKNYRRYVRLIEARLGKLSEMERGDLGGLFWEICHVEIEKLKSKLLDADGNRRSQAILGTLKAMAVTRVLEALRLQREQFGYDAQLSHEGENLWLRVPTRSKTDKPYWHCIEDAYPDTPDTPDGQVFFAAEGAHAHICDEDERTLKNIQLNEQARSLFTRSQFAAMNAFLRAGHNPKVADVAAAEGVSERKYFDRLKASRFRMWSLLPPELQEQYRDCLKRKDTR